MQPRQAHLQLLELWQSLWPRDERKAGPQRTSQPAWYQLWICCHSALCTLSVALVQPAARSQLSSSLQFWQLPRTSCSQVAVAQILLSAALATYSQAE